MKTKSEQVEIMTKALISRCHGLYSQEALGNEIMDFTERVVKLLNAPDVSKCDGIERKTSVCPNCSSDKTGECKPRHWCSDCGAYW